MIDKDVIPEAMEKAAARVDECEINSLKTKAYMALASVPAGLAGRVRRVMQRLATVWVQIEWPGDCCLCREPDANGAICKVCRALLSANLNACPSCAYPTLPEESQCTLPGTKAPGVVDRPVSSGSCVECQLSMPHFSCAAVPYLYRFPADQLVLELKYRDSTGIARAMARLMFESEALHRLLKKQQPDFLVPIPLDPVRFHQRGFNQAGQIAAWLSRYTGCPLRSTSLVRNIRKNPLPSQTLLGRQSRLDAFLLESGEGVDTVFKTSDVRGLKLLLVDDVMTTGATFHAAADALLDAGALSVGVCAFARTTH